jgi:AcrR family transcriptional regulator
LVRDTRAILVSAAAKLLDRGGPAAVTLREVGRIAGVSHNAPYKHFESKEDLLAAIASRELGSTSGGTAADFANPTKALRQLMHAYVKWARAKPQRFKLTFGSWKIQNGELAEAAAHSRNRLLSIVAAAQANRDLPPGDPDRVAALFLAVAHGAADLALSGHLAANGKGKVDPEDLIDDLITYLSAGRKSR